MRASTQRYIDELHAEIAAAVTKEKAHYDKAHPEENDLLRSIAHTRIEVAAWEPKLRKDGAKYATLTWPPMPKQEKTNG